MQRAAARRHHAYANISMMKMLVIIASVACYGATIYEADAALIYRYYYLPTRRLHVTMIAAV